MLNVAKHLPNQDSLFILTLIAGHRDAVQYHQDHTHSIVFFHMFSVYPGNHAIGRGEEQGGNYIILSAVEARRMHLRG